MKISKTSLKKCSFAFFFFWYPNLSLATLNSVHEYAERFKNIPEEMSKQFEICLFNKCIKVTGNICHKKS